MISASSLAVVLASLLQAPINAQVESEQDLGISAQHLGISAHEFGIWLGSVSRIELDGDVVSLTSDRTGYVWNWKKRRPVEKLGVVLAPNEPGVMRWLGVVVSQDGTGVLSREEGTLVALDLDTGKIRVRFPDNENYQCMTFSADGRMILTGEGNIKCWDGTTGKERWTFSDSDPTGAGRYFFQLDCSPNGKLVGALSLKALEQADVTYLRPYLTHIFYVLDAASGRQLASFEVNFKEGLGDCAFHPDGARFGILFSKDPKATAVIQVRDNETCRILQTIPTNIKDIRIGQSKLAASPDGRFFGSHVGVWEIKTARQIATLKDEHFAAFLPDGKRFATVTNKGILKFWRLPDSAD